MKLLFIILFLLSVMAFGENQEQLEVQGDEIGQNQEASPSDEACSFLDGLWYFTKFFTYNTLICPKMHTGDTEIKQCVWEEMKTAFSSPDALVTYLESFNFLDEPSISFLAGELIGNLGELQAKRCGSVSENAQVEEIKRSLDCGLQVIDNKRTKLKCRK